MQDPLCIIFPQEILTRDKNSLSTIKSHKPQHFLVDLSLHQGKHRGDFICISEIQIRTKTSGHLYHLIVLIFYSFFSSWCNLPLLCQCLLQAAINNGCLINTIYHVVISNHECIALYMLSSATMNVLPCI